MRGVGGRGGGDGDEDQDGTRMVGGSGWRLDGRGVQKRVERREGEVDGTGFGLNQIKLCQTRPGLLYVVSYQMFCSSSSIK